MKSILLKTMFAIVVVFFTACSPKADNEPVIGPGGEIFTKRIVAARLSDPWEITVGPDQFLWVTEAKGYRVSRVDPSSGAKKVILDLNGAKNFPRYDLMSKREAEGKAWPQSGLMGLALHPGLLSGKPYVYLSYIYHFAGAAAAGSGCAPQFGGCSYTTRIVRYRYDAKVDSLVEPDILCDTVPGSNDHNGGRLIIAPVDGKPFLFYSIGEMGAGQFVNAGRPNHAQDPAYYQGKILRFNTEPDGDGNASDRWVPNDNPFDGVVQSAVWSIGHRNPEGLAYASGKLYASEHGPFSDDEINLIEKGKNYGHPLIEGYQDGNYNGLAAGASEHKELPGVWHTAYPLIISEQENAAAIGPDYRDPMKSLYPTRDTALLKILAKTRAGAHIDWISEAPSSLDVYTSPSIPGWQNSLLLPTLKTGQLIRLRLNANGNAIVGDTLNYFRDVARYRDVAISADGKKIYLAVDSSAQSSGPTADKKKKSFCRGCIVEFSFEGMSTGKASSQNR